MGRGGVGERQNAKSVISLCCSYLYERSEVGTHAFVPLQPGAMGVLPLLTVTIVPYFNLS